MGSYGDYRSQVRSTLLAFLRSPARVTDSRPLRISVTRALATPTSPLSQHLKERFPHTRTAAREYSGVSGPLRIPRGTTDPGLIGTAFDIALRLLLVPQADVSVAFTGLTARRGLSATADVLRQLVKQLAPESQRDAHAHDQLARLAWVLGLSTTIYRTGRVDDSPLSRFRERRPTGSELLGLAGSVALAELCQLIDLASRSPISRVAATAHRLVSGPSFGSPQLLNADGDLILGDVLVDTKTSQGNQRSNGTWFSSVGRADLYQVLTYCLLDFDDRFAMRKVGFYAARYGELKVWTVEDFLEILSGGCATDLHDERERLRALLSAQVRSPSADSARRRLLHTLRQIPTGQTAPRHTKLPEDSPLDP
jgi:hypothetical protein